MGDSTHFADRDPGLGGRPKERSEDASLQHDDNIQVQPAEKLP
jgi:hypothetical protein